MNRGGTSLTELLVGLMLMGTLSAAVYRVATVSRRLWREQATRVALSDNLRAAATIVSSELRSLSSADPLGSDLIAMSDSTVTYKAIRALYRTCAARDGGSRLHLDTTLLGLRSLDPTRDSVLVLVHGNRSENPDGRWVHANVLSLTSNHACPGGARSLDISLAPALVDSIGHGSPVLAFEIVELRPYRDDTGAFWLGGRQFSKRTGWSTAQPLAGPLARPGFRLGYYDRAGNVTTDPSAVAHITYTVSARGGLAGNRRTDSLTTQVALRNNR